MAGDLRIQVLDGQNTNIRATVLGVGGLVGSQLVTLSDGAGNYPTTTTVGADIGLDVYVIGGTISIAGVVVVNQGVRDVTAEPWWTEEIASVDLKNSVDEDTDFVAGDSPVTVDLNAALGVNSTKGYLICDGFGDILVEYSEDGAVWETQFTLKSGDKFEWTKVLSLDSIRITHSGDDSAYRLQALK